MRKRQLVLAMALAWGIAAPIMAAPPAEPSSSVSKSGSTITRKAVVAPSAVATPTPATASGVKLPAVQKPTAPFPSRAPAVHGTARSALSVKPGEQARQAGAAHNALSPASGQPDPAAGTALGGREITVNGGIGTRDFSHLYNSQPSSDCVAKAADCVRGNASAGQGRGRFSAAPSVGASVPDRRSHAAQDNVQPGYSPKTWIHPTNKEPDGTIVDGTHTEYANGTSRQETIRTNPDSTTTVINEWFRADGTTTITNEQTGLDGTYKGYFENFDKHGNLIESGELQPSPPNRLFQGGRGNPGSGPAGQPGVDDGAVSGNGNCNWNPVWGRCMEQQKPSRNDMTAQPGRGENTASSAGSAARSRLGAEAVTNTGDAGYSASHGGRTGGGGPIDMRDPSRDPQGFGTPARSGFAPR